MLPCPLFPLPLLWLEVLSGLGLLDLLAVLVVLTLAALAGKLSGNYLKGEFMGPGQKRAAKLWLRFYPPAWWRGRRNLPR